MPITVCHVQSGLFTCHQQADPYQTYMPYPQGKDNVPQRCFPYSNWGQESLTSTGSFFEPTQGHHKTVKAVQVIRAPQSALQTSVGTDKVWWSLLLGTSIFPCGEHLPMAIQVNKSYKNQSSIGKCHVSIVNSKLDKYSYLVEYSWQAWSLDTLKYPKTIGQDPLPSHSLNLEP